MLATSAEPFDSEDYSYEVKWDGFRALAFVERGKLKILGRRKTDYTQRFSELSPLAKLPDGTLLDGEVVALVGGKPDFTALLKSRAGTTTYVAFDLLYDRFKWIGDHGVEARQARLAKMLAPHLSARVAVSIGRTGSGLAFVEEARKLGLEGVIAKKLGSPYEPGRRSSAWLKFKEQQQAIVSIIGYELNSDGKLRSLVLASETEGRFHFAGQVGSGIKPSESPSLLSLLRRHVQPASPIPVPLRGRNYRWVEPALFCRVNYLERLSSGAFRAPVFQGIYEARLPAS